MSSTTTIIAPPNEAAAPQPSVEDSCPTTRADAVQSLDQPISECESSPNTAEDESHYLSGTKFYLVWLSAAVVLVIAGMDCSIVAVAVPSITDHFHTVADVGWYSSAYRLCMCSFQFMFGKLYKIFPFKRIFLGSVAVFLVGSVICASAPTSRAFVIGRAVSGLAGAGIIAGCFTLCVKTLPLRKRALATSLANVVEGVSIIAAPLLGGLLVQINWRWCFIVNIPLTAVVLPILAFTLEDFPPATSLSWRQCFKELDVIGNVVLVPSLTCLFMVLGWAGTRFAWNSPVIIALLCMFVLLLAAFAVDQWVKQDSATLPPRILKNRSVLAGTVFSLCCNSAMNVIEYYLPTWLQAVKQLSPQESGYLCLPSVLGFMLASVFQGAGVSIIGYYVPFMLAGSVLMPVFTGLMTTLTVDSSIGTMAAFLTFVGFGCGIGFQSPQVAVQNTLSAADANMGLAIILFAQNFGPAVSIAVAQTVFTERLSVNLQHLAPGLNATTIENMGLSDLKAYIPKDKLQDALIGMDQSLVQTWYLAVGLTCVTIIGSASMEWKSVKQKKN